MIDKIFAVKSKEVSSLLVGDTTLMFSSQESSSVTEFQEAWEKKISFAHKIDIAYTAIKRIRKEEHHNNITMEYHGMMELPLQIEFSFVIDEDVEEFFSYIEKKHHFRRSIETLTLFQANVGYGIGLLITIAVTMYFYFHPINLTNAIGYESGSDVGEIIHYIIEAVGDKGIVVAGVVDACYLLYTIWQRVITPVRRIELLPPQA